MRRLRGWLRRVRAARECPCCGATFERFAEGGPSHRPDAKCRACGSLERHRLLWLLLQDRPELGRGTVLHVAPEAVIARLLTGRAARYVSADLLPGRGGTQMHIGRLALREGVVDLVLASHVLEHVPDDRAALDEMRRVLRPGGTALLHVPVDEAQAVTDEDPSVTDVQERIRRFGQDDHVRRYGRDFVDRVEAAGFKVEAWGAHVSARRRRKHGLAGEVAYLAIKPA